MKYIIEHKSYNQEEEIKDIISKYQKSGYISKSMSTSMDRISGVHGIYDQIMSRISKLTKFFDIFESDLIDDKLLEFFEDNYTYKINIGVSIEKPSYWSYSKTNWSLIPNNNYRDAEDKESYLFIYILHFVLNMNKMADIVSKERIEEHEREKGKNKFYMGPLNFDPANFFKAISHIQPMILVNVEHKQRVDYWNNEWDHSEMMLTMDGYSRKDFYSSKPDCLLERIKKRLSYLDNDIKPISVTMDGNPFYTSDEYYLQDGDPEIDDGFARHSNPNPILLKGDIKIKFDLSTKGRKSGGWGYYIGH